MKYDLVEDGSTDALERQQPSRRRSFLRQTVPFLLQLIAVCLILKSLHSHYYSSRPVKKTHACGGGQRASTNGNDTKVAMEAHIMSKCPDAKDCLQQLVVPAMAQVSDFVDFRLSYIGR